MKMSYRICQLCASDIRPDCCYHRHWYHRHHHLFSIKYGCYIIDITYILALSNAILHPYLTLYKSELFFMDIILYI